MKEQHRFNLWAVLCVILGISLLCALGPAFPMQVAEWFGIRLPLKIHYQLVVENRLDEIIIVEMYNLNDLPFELFTKRESINRIRAGSAPASAIKLHSKQSGTIAVPSVIDPALGFVLIVARGEMHLPGYEEAGQRIALYLIPAMDLRNSSEMLVIDDADMSLVKSAIVSSSQEHVEQVKVIKKTFSDWKHVTEEP